MHRTNLRTGLLTAALTLLVILTLQVTAEEEEKAEGFQNLEVFNSDIGKDQLKRVMKGFTKQLGVECTHCHIKDEYDKDDKEPKRVARKMITMMRHLNQNAAEYFPDEGYEKLRCWTCHRGAAEIEEFVMEDEEP